MQFSDKIFWFDTDQYSCLMCVQGTAVFDMAFNFSGQIKVTEKLTKLR